MTVLHPNHEEALYLYNQVLGLRQCIKKLEQERKPGRGQANELQAIHESAVALLIRSRVEPCVVALFSDLLRGVMKKSGGLDKRYAAGLAAAKAEAAGEERPEIVKAYAKVLGRTPRGCYTQVDELRASDNWEWMVESHRPPE